MASKTGYIVQWTNPQGETKRGHAYHEDQKQGFRENKKVVVQEIDANDKPIILHGRRRMFILDSESVKQIGFVN